MPNDLKKGAAAKTTANSKQGAKNKQMYNCSRCGKLFASQSGNFYKSPSTMYRGNNQFLTICKACVKELFLYMGDEVFDRDYDKVGELLCAMTNTYFDLDAWQATGRALPIRERLGRYFSMLNLSQVRHSDYTETVIKRLDIEADNLLMIEAEESLEKNVSTDTIKKFGLGFTEQDYETLQYEYDDWIDKYGPPEDKRQDELYKCTCYLKLQLQKSIQGGDSGVGALSKTYKDYVNTATIELEEMRQRKDDAMKLDPMGVWLHDIEAYTPAELYKNKSLYKDSDGIGKYVSRFITRPLRNLLTGSKELDKEFNLSDTES